MTHASSARAAVRFEVRFESLFHPGRALAFPSDSEGHVELEDFSEHARANYLFAMAMVGREYALPRITQRSCRGDPAQPATVHAPPRISRSI